LEANRLTRVSHRDLANWPAHLQAQINAKLAEQTTVTRAQAQVIDTPPPAPKPESVHVKGRMNGIETDFSAVLAAMVINGEALWWKHESFNFRLADRCWYLPDFFVVMVDGSVEIFETKGFMRDDAAVKLRMFRECYPAFGLTVVKRAKGGGWIYDRR
jgi:hypothetical protein